MAVRQRVVTRMHPELGKVRRCPRCRSWWPEDSEFYSTAGAGRFQAYCKACWAEIATERRRRARGRSTMTLARS